MLINTIELPTQYSEEPLNSSPILNPIISSASAIESK